MPRYKGRRLVPGGAATGQSGRPQEGGGGGGEKVDGCGGVNSARSLVDVHIFLAGVHFEDLYLSYSHVSRIWWFLDSPKEM